jgi:hypothetical protein
VIAAMAALGLAGSVYAIPIQVPDAVEVIELVQPLHSLADAFGGGLHSSPSMLRPMRWVYAWWLLHAGDALGGRFHLVFRGFHALAAALLVMLFATVARARTWPDVAALTFGLGVLLGTHTFLGMVREAYPINHFLIVALCGLAVFAIAQRRGGLAADTAIVLLAVAAALTLESGLLVVPIAVAAWVAGAPGVSRRVLVAMLLVVAGYAALRIGWLHIHVDGVGSHATGFGVDTLSEEQLVARFAAHPLRLYAYNVAMEVVSVLLSQPTAGTWSAIAAWRRGHVPPVFVIQILSSVATTLLIAWYLASRDERGRRRWREPLPLVFVTLLAANAVISFAYAKDEIISISGVFYALVAYAAVGELLRRQWTPRAEPARRSWLARAVPLTVVMLLLGSAWAMRTAGLHYRLAYAAFDTRGQWAAVLRPGRPASGPANARTRDVIARMKSEAILQRRVAGKLLPRWHREWWGEP